ncbi:hypothetical protein HanIR_Chr02g0061801 [Helianthus annuus]|nr:hypothetical protein HanIR_Chr02g0061801 [Helianthus annuus]
MLPARTISHLTVLKIKCKMSDETLLPLVTNLTICEPTLPAVSSIKNKNCRIYLILTSRSATSSIDLYTLDFKMVKTLLLYCKSK